MDQCPFADDGPPLGAGMVEGSSMKPARNEARAAPPLDERTTGCATACMSAEVRAL